MKKFNWNILKASFINLDEILGERLVFSKVTPNDAEFIVNLRTDEKKSRFLSATSSDIAKQIAYINQCLESDDQIYFIIRDFSGEPIGTVRLYDIIGDSFCWGSWIIRDNAPKTSAIESVLMVYNYAFLCGFRNAHIDVMKGNDSVISFHQRFGAKKTGETELLNYYQLEFEDILNSMKKYKKYLPNGIQVVITK